MRELTPTDLWLIAQVAYYGWPAVASGCGLVFVVLVLAVAAVLQCLEAVLLRNLDRSKPIKMPSPDIANCLEPMYVDPPSGWRYGFPRLWDGKKKLREFLLECGYPEQDVDFACSYCRFSPASEDIPEV